MTNVATLPREARSISTTMEVITPVRAREMLDTMVRNRPLKTIMANRIAREIAEGRWQFTGEAIKFDETGALVDGQNRLTACIKADRPIETLVVRGLPASTMLVLDTGKSRSIPDVLTIYGIRDGFQAAAVGRMIAMDEDHGWESLGQRNTGIQITAERVLRALNENPDYIAARTMSRGCKYMGSLSVFVFLALKFSRIDEEAAREFFHGLIGGENLAEGNPIFALRRVLVDRRQISKFNPQTIMAVTVKAWNAWRAGRPMQLVRWQRFSTPPEAFPAIKG